MIVRPFARKRGGKSRIWADAGKLPEHVEGILAMLRDRRPTQEVCTAILEAGVELLGVPKALAFVRFCDCATGATRHSVTIDSAYANAVLPDTFNGITGRALRTGKPQLVGDVRKDPDYVPLAERTRSELAVPLLLGGACYGVLNFESPERDAFAPAQVPWVQLLAQFAALAERFEVERGLHDSELLRGGTREVDGIYLRKLDETLDRVIATLGGARGLMAEVMMIVPHSDQLVTLRLRPNSSIAMHIRLRAGEGIAGRALQLGQPLSGATPTDNPESRGRAIGEVTHLHNTRSALAIPLRASDGAIVGLLNVESPHEGVFGHAAIDTLNREGVLAELANQLGLLQRETLTPETVVEDLLDTLEQQIAFTIDPDDLSGAYFQILQVAARIVSAPEVSAGLILVRDEAQSLVSVTPESKGKDYWAVRAARLGLHNSKLEWRLDDQSITRRVMETGMTVNVGNVNEDPDYMDSGTGYADSSELIAVLPNDHHPIGVIALVSPKLNAFTEADKRNVERVARIAAVAITRAEGILSARLSQEQLDAASELLHMLHPIFPADTAQLRDVDEEGIRAQIYDRILDLATSKTGSEYGAIVLAENSQSDTPNLAIKQEQPSGRLAGTKPRRPITEGITGQAYRTGIRVNVTDVTAAELGARFVPFFAGARSELAVPMKRGETIVGVLDIESIRPSLFTTAQIQWAEFLAEQAAFALAAVDLVKKSKIEFEFSNLSQRIDQEMITMRTLDALGIRQLRNQLLRDVLDLTCLVTGSAVGRVLVAMNVYPAGEMRPAATADPSRPDLEHGQFLRMVSTEPDEGPDAEGRYFPASEGIASGVLSEQRMVFFNDEDSRPKVFFTKTGRRIVSGLFVPILEGVRVAGVLDIESEREDAFTDDGIAAGQWASELVSKLLANTRLHLRSLERRQLRDFEMRILLNRSSDASRFMDEALGYAAQLADVRTGWGTIVEARRAENGAGWTAEHTHSMTYMAGGQKQFASGEDKPSALTFFAFQQALDTQTPVLILDSTELHTALEQAGMSWPARSLICVPLLQPVEDDGVGDAGDTAARDRLPAREFEPIGVLALASSRSSEFSEADKESLTLFAQTIVNGLKSVALLGEQANVMREVRHDFLRALPPLTVYMDALEEPLEAARGAQTLPMAQAELHTIQELTGKINSLVYLVAELMNWFFDLSNDLLEPETNLAHVISASSIIEILKRPIGELAKAYKRSVEWHLPANAIAITGGNVRERLISAVLFKYLDNAIKYGEEDVVTVTLAPDQDVATFAVRSAGKQVPLAERGRIFELYYRASNVDASQPGSGIGLFQAKQIAKALGGRVGYEAAPPRYNVLTLSVPLAGRDPSRQRHSS